MVPDEIQFCLTETLGTYWEIKKRLPADLHKYTKFQETMKTNYDTIIQEIYNLIKLYTEFNEICQK